MLINKGFSSGDVVSIKLINGDEIIAKFEKEDNETITINRKDGSITISKANTFFVVESKGEAATQYTEGTTGIALR